MVIADRKRSDLILSTINTRIVLRNDTSANWLANSTQILLKGEVGIEYTTDGKKKMKIGDGVTSWANLPYSNSDFNPSNGALLELITQEAVDRWNKAQPNTIEQIFVNNAEVSIIDKQVKFNIPTQASDIGAATEDHNHDGVYLKANETIPEELLPNYVSSENTIEIFKIAGTAMPIEDKTVDIPVASAVSHGVVKSSSGANQVVVNSDGAMRVGVISTSTLKIPIGQELILNGGSADSSEVVYATRINDIGYDTLSEAISAANYGDTVTLEGDLNLGTLDNDNLVVDAENVTLDTNGATITASGSNGAIKVTGGNTTITGNGTVAATLGSDNYSMAVWATKGNVVINDGTYQNATDGTDRGTDLIYASGTAQIEINGGTFIAAKPEWTLNCKDADYKAGTTNIIVKGGSFYKFDPANNNTEGAGTNYVADGYYSEKNGDYYVVKPISA